MSQHAPGARPAGPRATAGRWRLVLASAVTLALVGVAGTASAPAGAPSSPGGPPAMTEPTASAGARTHEPGPSGAAGSRGATAAATDHAPSGEPMPRGDLPGWTQVFADDFATPAPLGAFTTSAAYGRRWFPYGPYPDTSGTGLYDAERTVSVAAGVLDVAVHTEGGQPYVAALVPHEPDRWGQTYGRYSFRFRADTLPGYKLVAILWPDSDDWGEGEIDFPEVTQLVSDERIYANVFQKGSGDPGRPGPASRFTTDVAANDTGWHTATIEWLPGSVTTWLDGARLGEFTQGVPDTSFHLVFQIETNLEGAKPAEAVAGHVQLDWVTFYARS